MPGNALAPMSVVKFTPSSGGDLNSAAPAKERDYYKYEFARGVFMQLVESWMSIDTETERQRDLRYVKDCASEDLRAAGILKEDEVYTPARLIDTNIRAEQPSLIQYITQSRRSIIFSSLDGAAVDGIEKLEQDFTNKARYLEWEIPFVQNTDGTQAHGWASIEICFDPSFPGNFYLEPIPHERLKFALDSEDIEAQELVAVQKNLTSSELKSLVAEGFSQEQVEKLISSNAKAQGRGDCINVCYKVFFKQDDLVHVAWWAPMCDDYLKAPEPLFLGMRDFSSLPEKDTVDEATGEVIKGDYPPIYESEFPIVLRKYTESSDPRIIEINGRVKFDEAAQEAASALQSSMVNASLRSANVYASPKATPLDQMPSDLPMLTDIVIGNGRLFSRPVDFFTTPAPAGSMLQFFQAVVTSNKSETSQVNFAALTRKDSEKTATEINAAAQAKNELSSVQVILLSIFIRKVYAKCWRIYQNRVLQGKIIIRDVSLLNLFGVDIQIDEATGAVIACKKATRYIIKSSGDVDVIQRQEHLQRLLQGWEVFGKTPLSMEYLKDIIRFSFPEDAVRYLNVLEQSQVNEVENLKGLLMKVSQVLQAVIIDPATKQPIPSAAPLMPQLHQLAQQVQAALSGPTQQGQISMPQQPQQ